MARNTTKQVKLTPETHAALKARNRDDEYLGETIMRGLQALEALSHTPFEVGDDGLLSYEGAEPLDDFEIDGEALAQEIEADLQRSNNAE